MDKITIYTNETCPYCKAVKEKLTEEKIEFNERLTKDYPDEWNKIVSTVGVSTVPTIFYKQEYFIPGRDFANPVALVNTLNPITHKYAHYQCMKDDEDNRKEDIDKLISSITPKTTALIYNRGRIRRWFSPFF